MIKDGEVERVPVITAHPNGIASRVRSWVEQVGRRHDLGDGRAGEAFRVVDTR